MIINCSKEINLKGSDDGVYHSELLFFFWALSIVRNSKYEKTQRFGNLT
jgi:hypothetical protein